MSIPTEDGWYWVTVKGPVKTVVIPGLIDRGGTELHFFSPTRRSVEFVHDEEINRMRPYQFTEFRRI
jgi:hypothetical protein